MIAKTCRQPKCALTDERIKKMVHTDNGILLSHKKNEITPFGVIQMDPENIILTEVSQKEKDKYYMILLICEIQSMTQMNLSMKQQQIHRHRNQTCGCHGGDGLGTDRMRGWG